MSDQADQVQILIKQFLCGHPLKEMDYPTIKHLDTKIQEHILSSTVNLPLVLEYPLNINYQKAFIKLLMDKLQAQGLEEHETIYNSYGRLVGLSGENSTCYKHYCVGDNGRIITMKENVNLISEGTTGLRTWQASLALAQWCLNHKQSLENKTILELGSGVGLTGLVATLECNPKQFLFSDCHPSVLKTLCENIALNSDLNTKLDTLEDLIIFSDKITSESLVTVLKFPWEDVNGNLCDKLGKIDVTLAADVVYDRTLFESLIEALVTISNKCQVEDVIFACTERNSETLEEFLELVGKRFKISEEARPAQRDLIWVNQPAVKLFRFTLI